MGARDDSDFMRGSFDTLLPPLTLERDGSVLGKGRGDCATPPPPPKPLPKEERGAYVSGMLAMDRSESEMEPSAA